jgi:5-methylthioadenosine/S-adenosylhomocysteine deaminase
VTTSPSRTLLTVDTLLPTAAASPLRPGYLRWSAGVLTEVGEGHPAPLQGEHWVHRPDGLALPGLVNTHHHLAGTITDGLTEDGGIEVGTRRSGWEAALHASIDGKSARAAALLAAVQMIRSGITTTTDSHATWRDSDRIDGSLEAAEASGLRVILHVAFLDRTELIPKHRQFTASGVSQEVTRLRTKLQSDLVEIEPEALSLPRATDELVLAVHDARKRLAAIHLNYSREFRDWSRHALGAGAVQHLARLGVLDSGWILAHPIHLEEGEAELLGESGAGCSYSPVSNLSLALDTPDLLPLRSAGVAVGVGLDHPNGSNDLWATARTAALLQRGVAGQVPTWTAADALHMATQEGARALGLAHLTGRLEPGLSADVQVLDLRDSALTAARMRPERVALAAHPGLVKDVAVRGEWLLSDDRLTKLDEESIVVEAREVREALLHASRSTH